MATYVKKMKAERALAGFVSLLSFPSSSDFVLFFSSLLPAGEASFFSFLEASEVGFADGIEGLFSALRFSFFFLVSTAGCIGNGD